MKIFIASDHAAFEQKAALIDDLKSCGHEVVDLGPFDSNRSDYPVYAKSLAQEVVKDSSWRGILLCGSGIGMSMAANRFQHIRAALCRSVEEVKLARGHNDANVLCLGARISTLDLLKSMAREFIVAPFEGGRHQQRIELFTLWGEKTK